MPHDIENEAPKALDNNIAQGRQCEDSLRSEVNDLLTKPGNEDAIKGVCRIVANAHTDRAVNGNSCEVGTGESGHSTIGTSGKGLELSKKSQADLGAQENGAKAENREFYYSPYRWD